ncbi:hypothetical protein PR202_ga27540 [Eleusine coracana subsp. coracana]|uniref:DUF4220 domain-containing protein n=1 Tax=Eleusine coracana subsp. coracana TaxID=191504 RepID=A0AAV5DH49_ELECO|nr:hypothetical protein PR202_ga27540 [Eleusine coracana subsp. coracana]
MVVASSFLVQITMVDTSVAVAVDDREGQNLGPPWELLVQGVWTFYLGISSLERVDTLGLVMEFMPCVLMMVKVLLKCYAFLKARQSIALGQNPRLIFAYMQQPQLEEASQHVESHADDGEVASPPPLLVVGEEGRHVEKQPCGFARYELTKSSSTGTLKFFWSLLMEDGEPDRIFGLHDPILCSISCIGTNFYNYSYEEEEYFGRWTLFLSPDQVRSVKIPAAVKVCIIDALRNSKNGGLTNGTASLLRNQQVGESFLWACNGKGTSDVILTWHIATAILKVRHPYVADEEQGSGSLPFSDYEITATQLSLGKQLVELEGVGTAWKLLADFWSEMILFATPSDNLKGHAEAIARGGELITLLWVLLFHAGIVNRPGNEGRDTNAAGAV